MPDSPDPVRTRLTPHVVYGVTTTVVDRTAARSGQQTCLVANISDGT